MAMGPSFCLQIFPRGGMPIHIAIHPAVQQRLKGQSKVLLRAGFVPVDATYSECWAHACALAQGMTKPCTAWLPSLSHG